jgi:predicted ATPase
MLTKLEIYNYKSIYNATIELSPFTLLIGANGTGKSNLISLLREKHYDDKGEFIMHKDVICHHYKYNLKKHFSHESEDQAIKINTSEGLTYEILDGSLYLKCQDLEGDPFPEEIDSIRAFQLDPSLLGDGEPIIENPTVHENGAGVIQVLDSLKTGDREDAFRMIEKKLAEYVPEIEKIIFVPEKGFKKLQVREKHISKPVPVEILSEGTKLVLTILTILYQENPPSLVCIEDIDRGLHPRLFQQIVELCNDLSRKLNIQIIATTHNPYILDEFVGNESAVVIVEKKEGCTTFTTLAERLAQVQDNGEEMPLGAVWYSGLVGGVPKR